VTSLNISEKFEDCCTPPILEHHETAIVDYGCTGHFLLINAPFQNKVKSQNHLRVHLPNGETMDSTHIASLDIPELSQAASISHVLPGMENHSLLSLGQLCNEGCYVTFSIEAVIIYNSTEKAILKRQQYLNTVLWHINLLHEKPQHTIYVANNVYELRNTGFSQKKSALLQAVKKGHLTTWSGLTEQAINKHLKMTQSNEMGHMNQRRQNIRSTSKDSITSEIEDDIVTPAGLGSKTHLVYAVVVDQGQLYTDITGRFPVRSSKGIWYVMICYSYDCKYVTSVPMKSRYASEWLKAYGGIHQELTSRGFKHKHQMLDNEASSALISFSSRMMWHRYNPTERVVRTFKEHFFQD
jgi:hypothetical protein